MGSPWVPGIIAGLAASGLSIAGTLRRGDPHLVSAPGFLSAFAVAMLVYAAVRSAARRSGDSGRQAGMRATLAASGVCAIAQAVFTWVYLPNHALTLAGFAALGSFVLVYLAGYAATRLGARSSLRLHRTAPGSSPS